MAEHPDHHTYHLFLYTSTLQYFIAAVEFYESVLKEDIARIEADPDLKIFFSAEEADQFPVRKELERVDRVLVWLRDRRAEGDDFSVHLSISHSTVRFLKSVAKLYEKHLENRRDVLARRPNISRQALAAVDQKLTEIREKSEVGVFKDASSIPLLAAEISRTESAPPVENEASPSLAVVRAPRPVVMESIEVLDAELRGRCMDLFDQFKETGQHERLDTVVSEATRILEVRLRLLSGAPASVVGVELATFALATRPTRIVLSDIAAEQEAAHLLFRGVFGFIRNPVHHHLVANLAPQRVLQIVGTVDYLLSLLDATSSVEPST